ncbi:ubiquinone biosynthesis protein UbiJ [Tamilnaduibacter salinus]|uniref:Ubiquinone biosynthesis accessory factor UbiJ n=1 Tax=Tamilnaduibacter salinus TaxID=1484056 RepID=A0A2U1CW78_9GAMM|nr:SCP2 sterol-binding domain-containing protein [Tamilnaduibacter salinus]PVY75984.1 ubiquinone biosynthesis protein UbiJ [Tamilnaduibacter salinus]
MFPGPTLLSAAETALNRALALDPAGRRALLAALSGPVTVTVNTIGITVTLTRSGDRIGVGSQPAEDASLTLSGGPMAFVTLALGDDAVFSDGRLTVDGDVGQAHALQRALLQLDPDWEAALAERIGELPAHFLGQRVRSALRWQRQAMASITASLEEYLHEETRALPGRRELSATFEDIDQMALRTDRLEARIQRLASSDGESS